MANKSTCMHLPMVPSSCSINGPTNTGTNEPDLDSKNGLLCSQMLSFFPSFLLDAKSFGIATAQCAEAGFDNGCPLLQSGTAKLKYWLLQEAKT